MRFQTKQKNDNDQRGLTVVELLFVMSIVVVLSAIALAALNDSREKGRNAARIAQIQEYRKAFQIYHSDFGYYPHESGTESGAVCLGDYDDDNCWLNGTSVSEQLIADTITPKYMQRLPKGEAVSFGDSTSSYEGMIYEYQDHGESYRLQYFMEGAGQNCFLPDTTSYNIGDDTLCTFNSAF